MKTPQLLLVAIAAAILVGCSQPLPENPMGSRKADPAMAEARIKEAQDNPRFTQAQKDQMIATIKQKNHLQ